MQRDHLTDNMDGMRYRMQSSCLVIEKHSPEDVARAMIESGGQKEPFYICDLDEAYRRIQHFKDMMPRIKIYYAMKANDSDFMIKLCVATGLGFDCASPGEIKKVLQLKVSPRSIIYAVPTKTPEQMMFARDAGVKHTTFDSSYELKKIKQNWPDARLLIRIRVDGDSKYKLGDKFGCDIETEAVDLLEEAASLGLKVVGVAFHVGSVCSTWDSHTVGLQRAKKLFDHESRAGRKMNIVDIGGGFLSDRLDRIDQVARVVNQTLEELFPDPSVQVIAEPGRYLCDSSLTLYCNICNIRRSSEEKSVTMLYLNDGLYGTLRFSEPWHVVSMLKRSTEKENGKLEEVILWGPSCDSTDRIMAERRIRLPSCSPLDWLVFSYQGAYTFGFSSNFSCLQTPQTRTVVSMELWKSIKDKTVFEDRDFTLSLDIAVPLPLSLPRLLPNTVFYEHPETPKLLL